MATRYDYDLDANSEWRWIAIAETGEVSAISPVGYERLQDCMNAVGLMQAPGNFAVSSAPVEPPDEALSRLQRRP